MRNGNKIGSIYIYQGNYPTALDYLLNSLKIKEELKDLSGISDTYTNIGKIFFEQYEPEEALKYFFKSIAIDSATNNTHEIATTFMNIGAVYNSQGEYVNALDYFNKSLKVHEKFNDKQNIATCYTNIAIAYEDQGDFEKAITNYNHSLEICKEIGAQQGIAAALFNLGYLHSTFFEFDKAITYLEEAINIAMEIGSMHDIEKSAYALSEAYNFMGEFKEAYKYLILYQRTFEKRNNEDNIRKFTQLEMQYTFDKKQKEIEFEQQQKELAHQAEVKRQRIILAFLSIGVLFLFAFIFFIYRSYKRKQKDNELLRKQKKEITNQRDQIVKQKLEITDSIHYAKRIQTAVLPPDDLINSLLPDYFILYEPRDIVSGDYYWFSQKEDKIIVVAADCTGHGVPGAFMSMLGISFLNEIVNQNNNVSPDVILNELRNYVIRSLRQTGKSGEAKDGMDLALTIIDFEKQELQFSGAYNPLYFIKNSVLEQIKADKMPIGISVNHDQSFSQITIPFDKGDVFYLFSDGYVDQFGGPNDKKFKSRKFKELLLEIHEKDMDLQKDILRKALFDWKGDGEQIDDILVIGMKM